MTNDQLILRFALDDLKAAHQRIDKATKYLRQHGGFAICMPDLADAKESLNRVQASAATVLMRMEELEMGVET